MVCVVRARPVARVALRFVRLAAQFGPGMVYTGLCLRVAVRHPTPPGQECSKGKWPLPGAWRFSYIFMPFAHTVEPMPYSR